MKVLQSQVYICETSHKGATVLNNTSHNTLKQKIQNILLQDPTASMEVLIIMTGARRKEIEMVLIHA